MPTDSMITTSKKAYDEYGWSQSAGMPYFDTYLEQFSKYDSAEVIAFQVRNYCNRYSLDFLLSAPSLWREMDRQSWRTAMSLACPRPAPTPTTTGLDAYADVVFLCKYVGVDGIKLFVEANRTNGAESQRLTTQVKIHYLDLILAEHDAEDLDGAYFVSRKVLEDARQHLTEEGLSRFDNDEASVKDYIGVLNRF